MSDDDEIKDPLEEMDEEEEEEDVLLDPKKLKKRGLHIDGEEDIANPEIADPLLDDGLVVDDDDEVELEDPAFKDPDEW